nr:MAG TPA: hypothetical protein [Caudoviricetes sp.]
MAFSRPGRLTKPTGRGIGFLMSCKPSAKSSQRLTHGSPWVWMCI